MKHAGSIFRSLFVLCVLVLPALFMPGLALAEKRVALVIGNGAYAVGALPNPPKDAKLMAAALRDVGFDLIERQDADQKTMKRAVAEFGQKLRDAGADAVGLVFYAGHGVQVAGENYLIPIDAHIDAEADFDLEAVAASTVVRQMEGAGNRINLLILDACRDNPFKRSSRSATRGLERMDAGRGTLIAYATAPGSVASDGSGANSPYTEALVVAMRTPGLKVEEVFKQVRQKVNEGTSGKQIPWESSSLIGDLYFVPKSAAVAAAPAAVPAAVPAPAVAPPADEAAFELAFWQSVQNSTDPADFDDYLSKFPRGSFAGLAKRKRDQLKAAGQQAAAVAVPVPATSLQATSVPTTYAPQPVTVLRNCPECPELVVIPAGSFQMGSPSTEPGRDDDEDRHRVTIGSAFAVGRYEVSFAEWDACVAGGGCRGYRPSDEGWGRGKMPVINVSWEDAQSYVEWLSRRTGQKYRLLSQSEWEYAARGGTTTPFWWGSEIMPEQANYDGKYVYEGGGRKGEDRQKTVPVDSFAANPFGLFNVHGNVAEWVEDCWSDYKGAPTDGRAYTAKDCVSRILRGGSWGNNPSDSRSANRDTNTPDLRFNIVGFRVARTVFR